MDARRNAVHVAASPAHPLFTSVRNGLTKVWHRRQSWSRSSEEQPVSRREHAIFVGVNVLNPLVYLGVAAMQGGIVLIACLGPALRAARIDPLLALRGD